MIHNKKDLITYLFKIGAIQIGEFRLINGLVSPIYIDLRRIISFPDVYQYVVDLFAQEVIEKKFHHIVGVPYAALPLASGIALLYQKPMIMIRKEEQRDALEQRIEGIFKKGDTAIIIEDIVASGTSIQQTIDLLAVSGITVEDVIVFIDRQQGAHKKLAQQRIKLHAICTLADALLVLQEDGYLDKSTVRAIDNFINEHQF